MKYTILNKVTLFICQDYIYRTKKDGKQVPLTLNKLESAISGYKVFHMFSQEEANIVLKMAKSKEIDDIMSKEVSFLIFVYELMKLWIEYVPKEHRPHLNISDKHFKLGGRVMWQQLLSLKKFDTEDYNNKQEVITDSITVANEFFDYHKEKLCM